VISEAAARAYEQALSRFWHPLLRAEDLGRGPQGCELLGRPLSVFRMEGELVCLDDVCRHFGASLSLGDLTPSGLRCRYHGWTYGRDGVCVDIPARRDAPIPRDARVRSYHIEERYGLVWVCVGTPAAPIPTIAQEDDPRFRRINTPVEVWNVSATRMVDNFLDITHFPFVHVGTFGRSQDTQVPRFELQPLDDEFYGYRYEVLANNSTGTLVSGDTAPVVHRSMSSAFNLPFIVRSTIAYDSGLEHILLLLSTPIDDVTSYFTFVVWRNDDFSVSAEEIIRFDLAIGAEDKRMLEQLDGVLPLDQTSLVSVQADKCSVEWRRQLAELMKSSV
jgi:phenylpropionate dioxygenase-like ring-hydroxylating dioxygenase large terminal subunit